VDVKLKQRLTGAVIFTSLAVILLPLLLDGTEEDRASIAADIPAPPKIDLEDITVQGVTRKIEQMERASKARLPKEVVDETNYDTGQDYVLDKNGLPVNWSLQLGSFQKEDNATRLRAQLRGQSYRSYILHKNTNGGETYRVFVGPSSSRETLVKINQKVEVNLNLKGRIVRYRIEEDRDLLGG
jgi:DedD protein